MAPQSPDQTSRSRSRGTGRPTGPRTGRRNGRRVAVAALGTALLCGLLAGSATAQVLQPGGTFVDDEGNIHEPYIEAIAAEGITRGCNPPLGNLYCPGSAVTRGQAASFLVRALDVPAGTVDAFIDDDGSVHEADIDSLAAAGVLRGCNPPVNDLVCPTEPMTRAQMASLIVRALGLTDGAGDDLFVDDDGSTHELDIDALATSGITKGCNPPTNDRYCPEDPVRRDEMASFLARMVGLGPVFVRPIGPEKILFTRRTATGSNVASMNPDATGVVQLTLTGADSSPSLALDGTQIAFRGVRGERSEILVMASDGSDIRQVTTAGGNFSPRWSPDGQRIAFEGVRGGDGHVLVMNADGSNVRQLTAVPGNAAPSWSPDGGEIVFQGLRDGATHILVMNADGTDKRQLTAVGGNFSPRWSPDGSQIVWEGIRDGDSDLLVMNADGSDKRQLTDDAAPDRTPAWSPDGTRIVWSSETEDGSIELFTMNANGSNPRQLTDTVNIDEVEPVWGYLAP